MEHKIEILEIKNETLWSGPQDEIKMEQPAEEAKFLSIHPQFVKLEQDQDKEESKGTMKFQSEFYRFLKVKKEIKHEPDEVENKFMNFEIDLPTIKNEESKNVAKKNKYPCLLCNKNYSSCTSKYVKKRVILCRCGKYFTDPSQFSRHYFVHLVKEFQPTGNKTSNSPNLTPNS